MTADEARLHGTAGAVAAAANTELAGCFFMSPGTVLWARCSTAAADLARFIGDARPIEPENSVARSSSSAPGPDHDFQAYHPARYDPRAATAQGRCLDPALVQPLAAVFEHGDLAISDLFIGPAIGRPLVWALAPVRRGGR